MYADSVALPAFARRAAVRRAAIDRYPISCRPNHSGKVSCCGPGQIDGRTERELHRTCSAYYADSANNGKTYQENHLQLNQYPRLLLKPNLTASLQHLMSRRLLKRTSSLARHTPCTIKKDPRHF